MFAFWLVPSWCHFARKVARNRGHLDSLSLCGIMVPVGFVCVANVVVVGPTPITRSSYYLTPPVPPKGGGGAVRGVKQNSKPEGDLRGRRSGFLFGLSEVMPPRCLRLPRPDGKMNV